MILNLRAIVTAVAALMLMTPVSFAADSAQQDTAKQDTAKQDTAKQDKISQDKVAQDSGQQDNGAQELESGACLLDDSLVVIEDNEWDDVTRDGRGHRFSDGRYGFMNGQRLRIKGEIEERYSDGSFLFENDGEYFLVRGDVGFLGDDDDVDLDDVWITGRFYSGFDSSCGGANFHSSNGHMMIDADSVNVIDD